MNQGSFIVYLFLVSSAVRTQFLKVSTVWRHDTTEHQQGKEVFDLLKLKVLDKHFKS